MTGGELRQRGERAGRFGGQAHTGRGLGSLLPVREAVIGGGQLSWAAEAPVSLKKATNERACSTICLATDRPSRGMHGPILNVGLRRAQISRRAGMRLFDSSVGNPERPLRIGVVVGDGAALRGVNRTWAELNAASVAQLFALGLHIAP